MTMTNAEMIRRGEEMLVRLRQREAEVAGSHTSGGAGTLGQSRLAERSRDIEALRDLVSVARGVLGIR